jgi:hypothetical protein
MTKKEFNALKIIEIDKKTKTEKKVTLIKTDYEEGKLQPTPAGHLQSPLFLSPHDILKIILDVKQPSY